jgi:hypothetical protein
MRKYRRLAPASGLQIFGWMDLAGVTACAVALASSQTGQIWHRLNHLSFINLAGFPHLNYLPDSAATVYGIRGILRVGEAR